MSEQLRAIPPFFQVAPARQVLPRPTAREWTRHLCLFGVTFITSTIAGLLLATRGNFPEPSLPEHLRWFQYLPHIPGYYVAQVKLLLQHGWAHPELLAQGVLFALSLLAILTAHEFGHYLACRSYGVDSTLPYFLPAPPLFLAGTFGAFIKIRSPIPSRRALFDIGVAGPIAGFVVAVPVALLGLATAQNTTATEPGQLGLEFHNSLLWHLLARVFDVSLATMEGNPFYYAAWIGLLVTSLNLMPVGQLDGGHASFAIFGVKTHKWLGRAAFLGVAFCTALGWIYYGSPSGFLYTVLLAFMLRVRHPEVYDQRPLGQTRLYVAALTLLIFLLSFLPVPITILAH
jgi:membrane-associated protease RseP (regulator of RpoE activity)